jgi:hypothetical protein
MAEAALLLTTWAARWTFIFWFLPQNMVEGDQIG